MSKSASPDTRPLAVTMGDPAGIGPEIVARMFLRRPTQRCWIVVGDALVMRHALAALDPSARVRRIATPAEARFGDGMLNVLASSECVILPPVGNISAESGRAAYAAIRTAIQMARDGAIRGIVTAPIHKEALAAAGLPYPGHTEILAEQAGGGDVAMMLANEEIRVVLVTIHCSLRDAIRRSDFPAQIAAIRLAHAGARALGVERPRVAVAGPAWLTPAPLPERLRARPIRKWDGTAPHDKERRCPHSPFPARLSARRVAETAPHPAGQAGDAGSPASPRARDSADHR